MHPAEAAESPARRPETVARLLPLLALAIAFVHGAARTWRTWGNPYVDSGREWELPRRLAEGALLYRDARFYYGPLAPYLNATLYELFGVHLDVLVCAGLASAALLCAAVYLVSREFLGRWVAAAVGVSFVYLAAFAQLQPVSIFNFVLPYSSSATYGMVAAAFSLALLLVHVRTGRPAPMIGAALCLALAALSKIEALLPALMAHGGFVLVRGRRLRLVHFGSYAAAVALVLAALGFLAWEVGPALWQDNLGGVLNEGSRHYLRLVTGVAAPDASAAIGISLAALGGALACAWMAARLAARPGLSGAASTAILALAGAGVFAAYAALDPRVPFRSLPFLAVAALGAHGVACLRRRGDPGDHLAAVVLWAFAVGCLARIPFQSSPYHYGFYLLPVALAGLAALVARDAPRLLGGGAWVRRASSVVCVALLSGAALRVAIATRGWAAGSDTEIVTQRGRMRLPGSWPDAAVLSWLSRWPPGTTLLTVPQGAGYAFLSGLSPGDSMFSYLPMEVAGDAADERLRARWEASPPDLVLWTEHDMSWDFGVRGFGVDYARRSARWIRDNYELVAGPAGPTSLLARRGTRWPERGAQPQPHHPHLRPAFCPSSQARSGAKYSSSADASGRVVPVTAAYASGHGREAPSRSIAPSFAPASFDPKTEHWCSGPWKPAAWQSARWNWNW
jgi:hypothetical protein